jgi:hypothetical protein
MTVTGLADVLRERPTIELWGPNSVAYIPTPPQVHATLILGHRPIDVPATITYEQGNYHLTLKVDPATLPATGKVEIDLAFDLFFVPRKINGSADDRELVFFKPNRAEFRQAHP